MKPDDNERRSRDTRPQPEWRPPATPCKAARSAAPERAETAAWRSRWYSAAKRFGLTVVAVVGAIMLLDVASLVLLGIDSQAAHCVAKALQSLSSQAFLWNPLPVAAAAWGFLWPRRYLWKPSLVDRVFVVGWTAVVLASFALSVLAGYLLVSETDRSPESTAKSPSTPCRTVPAPSTSSGSPTDPATQSLAADESHAESAEGAEWKTHAEAAESAEPNPHAEAAEGAKSE